MSRRLATMTPVALPDMAKKKQTTGTGAEADPNEEVRFVGKMKRSDRARFRYFCDKLGRDMEDVGVEWILERLNAEMTKRGWRAD